MTKKEQLYAQDVKNHAKQFQDLCCLCKETIDDPTLKSFLDAVNTENNNTFTKVSSLLAKSPTGGMNG